MKLFELTQSEIMFYGGIVGIAFLILLSIILTVVFVIRKRKLVIKIEEEF